MKAAEVYMSRGLQEIQAYMPRNYTARWGDHPNQVLIEGEDNAGWTLEDYVIPRLASGMITAKPLPYDIYTYDKAQEVLEIAEKQIKGDFPSVGDADVSWSAIEALVTGGLGSIEKGIARMVLERELGLDPVQDRETFERYGLE